MPHWAHFAVPIAGVREPWKIEGQALAIELVPCDEPHRGQVVGEFDIEEKGDFPGEEAVTAIADERCPAEAGEFAPNTWALPEGGGLSYYTPTAESWATGDRAVSCTYTKESASSPAR